MNGQGETGMSNRATGINGRGNGFHAKRARIT